MAKMIVYGEEARKKLQSGIDPLADRDYHDQVKEHVY